jgi:hypothetical protein
MTRNAVAIGGNWRRRANAVAIGGRWQKRAGVLRPAFEQLAVVGLVHAAVDFRLRQQ